MKIRSLLLGGLLALGTLNLVVAQAGVDLDIRIAPPAPRVEVVPAPRVGYIWAPGYWAYRGHQHVWVDGHWLHERRGYHWVPERWEAVGPAWRLHRGYWQR